MFADEDLHCYAAENLGRADVSFWPGGLDFSLSLWSMSALPLFIAN